MFEVREESNWEIAEPATKPDLTLKRRKLEERLEKRKIALEIDAFEDASDSLH
tara:strand:- start:874 stop:1032 length:159 start_codon:yes stop_codon:yes gene_type:complete